MKHHECPNDLDPTRSYRDGVIECVPDQNVVHDKGNVYVYCTNNTTGRTAWANCHPKAQHMGWAYGVRWWMDGHEVTKLGTLLMDAEDEINDDSAKKAGRWDKPATTRQGKERITVMLEVDTTKVKTRAIEDALIELLSQWQADERIDTFDLCIDKIKEFGPCQ